MSTKTSNKEYEFIPFAMHPRVFSALGDGLITNDIVAVIELVKNSYDAFATKVFVRFGKSDETGEDYIEIEDNGLGMTEEIIRNVWCTVATPYKENEPTIRYENKKRRVVGEKGLGRLSAARLGNRLQLLTKSQGDSCWELTVNWSEISKCALISECKIGLRKLTHNIPFSVSGTKIKILDLHKFWDENDLNDLKDNLSRLLSPFSQTPNEFNIFLESEDESIKTPKVELPEFLTSPKYIFSGNVDKSGNVKGTYRFNPIKSDSGVKKRSKVREIKWDQIYEEARKHGNIKFDEKNASCGSFDFEIRAWDIGPEDTAEIADNFDIQKNKVRSAIRAHKGISVYRDNVLVLPKSDTGRDWLGLDLRRISKVGSRLSTSQIVGYVAISADKNSEIKDTSDRERLVSNQSVSEFKEILLSIIAILETERDTDRTQPEGRNKRINELFAELTADSLVSEIKDLVKEGADASETVTVVQSFNAKLKKAKENIQERLVYYSRLATVGTIAQVLVHEIRNRTTSIGSFISLVKERFGPFKDKEVLHEYNFAYDSVHSLERLADTFAPLANRAFSRRNKSCILEERIKSCLSLCDAELKSKNIDCYVPESETAVAIDPGELDSILINLITNSLYWLTQNKDEQRKLIFNMKDFENGKRIQIWVHDNGPGLHEDDIEKVFWPGVTRKPGGIGMGLTVASEIVSEYGGRMSTKYPGVKKGASFAFDLPKKG